TVVVGASVVAGVGLAIGWRIHTGVADAAGAFGLALLFGYAFTWVGACLGMVLRSPEAAQQMGFVLFLPLTFVSNAFVPTQGMPGWLQPIANWNPMSALAAASRELFGNPNPAASVQAWPMQHPELAVVAWSAALLLIFAPLAVHLYRRKSAGWPVYRRHPGGRPDGAGRCTAAGRGPTGRSRPGTGNPGRLRPPRPICDRRRYGQPD